MPIFEEVAAALRLVGARHRDIACLEIFGSLARGDQNAGSDVDVLLSFVRRLEPGGFHYFGRLDELAEEMSAAVGGRVDLHDRSGAEQCPNALRRASALNSARVVYGERGEAKLLTEVSREARQALAAVRAGNRRGFFEDILRVIGAVGALSIVGHTLGRLDAPTRERLAARGAPVPLLLSLPARIGEGWQIDGEFLWKTAIESMEPLLAAIGPLSTA